MPSIFPLNTSAKEFKPKTKIDPNTIQSYQPVVWIVPQPMYDPSMSYPMQKTNESQSTSPESLNNTKNNVQQELQPQIQSPPKIEPPPVVQPQSSLETKPQIQESIQEPKKTEYDEHYKGDGYPVIKYVKKKKEAKKEEEENGKEKEIKKVEEEVKEKKEVPEEKKEIKEIKETESKIKTKNKFALEMPGNVYEIVFLKAFKTKCQKKPKDMREIDIPLKSNINIDFSPYEKEQRSETAETVRNLRILLNKLAKDNFARISDTILNNFQYTDEILDEFARIFFNKCVKEPNYIEVYMMLAENLFKKFKVVKETYAKGKEEQAQTYSPSKETTQAKDPIKLDFRSKFLRICERTFKDQENEDFLKDMPADLDEEEKKQKKKQRIFGNMKLIGHLYIRGYIGIIAVKQCMEKFLKNITEDNIENACALLLTIGRAIYEGFAYEAYRTTNKKKPKVKLKGIKKEEFDDYIDKLVELKQTDKVSSRIKFMIQDVIEARDQDWGNAFDYIEVPPQYVKKAEAVALRKKTRSIEKQESLVPPTIQKTPQEIIPDPKIEQRELRKKSVNEQNVFEINLEKYKKTMIDQKIRMRLQNYIEEYSQSKILEDIIDGIKELSEKDLVQKAICIGHFLMWSFSQAEKQTKEVNQLIMELKETNFFSVTDIEEG